MKLLLVCIDGLRLDIALPGALQRDQDSPTPITPPIPDSCGAWGRASRSSSIRRRP